MTEEDKQVGVERRKKLIKTISELYDIKLTRQKAYKYDKAILEGVYPDQVGEVEDLGSPPEWPTKDIINPSTSGIEQFIDKLSEKYILKVNHITPSIAEVTIDKKPSLPPLD